MSPDPRTIDLTPPEPEPKVIGADGRVQLFDQQELKKWLINNLARVENILTFLFHAKPSAFGEMYLQAATASFPDLGSSTWVTITQYDATIPANAEEANGIKLDLVNGTLTFTVPGVWRMDFSFNMSHNESNQGRTMEIRLYNEADNFGLTPTEVAIGRNQPGTTYSFATFFDISEDDINEPFHVEMKMISGSGSLSSINFTALTLMGSYADNFKNYLGLDF